MYWNRCGPGRSLSLRFVPSVSPTVLRARGYRLYFFSREESRMHVHVHHERGEAKFWLEPRIALAASKGLSRRQLADATRLIREHEDEIRAAWQAHFGR
jgi:hypothetical protein